MVNNVKQTEIKHWSVMMHGTRAVLAAEVQEYYHVLANPSPDRLLTETANRKNYWCVIGARDVDFSSQGFVRDGQIWKREDAGEFFADAFSFMSDATTKNLQEVQALFTRLYSEDFDQWYVLAEFGKPCWQKMPEFHDWTISLLYRAGRITIDKANALKDWLQMGIGLAATSEIRGGLETLDSIV